MNLMMNLNIAQRKRLHQIVFVATFGGLLFGYDTGVINGALSSLKESFKLSLNTQGLIMGVLLGGAAIGSLVGGRLADFIGRRQYLLYLSFAYLFGTVLSILSPNLSVLLIARFILGYAVGGASLTAPAFISEIAPVEQRGKLTGLNEVAVVGGQFLAFVINAIIGYFWGHIPDIWRYMLLIQTIPAICLLIGMWRSPESPRWLISKNRREEALIILQQIRPQARALQEYQEIVDLIDLAEKNFSSKSHFAIILASPWIVKLICIGIIWAAIQQTTGINVIMYYGTEILKTAGFSGQTALFANVLNGVLSVFGMAFGVIFLVDKFKRKTLAISGFAIMAILHLITFLTDSYLVSDSKPIVIWLLGACFVGVMQSTLGFLTWVMLSEFFPLKFRGLSMGICVFFNWISNATVAYLFPILQAKLGLGTVFLIFALINIASILFVKVFLPETANKSLEELEEELSAK